MYIACIIKLFLDFILFASSLWVLRKISLSIMVWHLYEFAAMEKYMICHVLLGNMFDFWQKYRNVAKLNKLILKILQSLIKKWGLLGFLDQKIDRTVHYSETALSESALLEDAQYSALVSVMDSHDVKNIGRNKNVSYGRLVHFWGF